MPKRTNGRADITVNADAALLTAAICSHPDCTRWLQRQAQSAYRITARRFWYYRCSGAQPVRKGRAAPLIPATELENLVNVFTFLNEDEYYTEITVSAGNAYAAEIATIEADLAVLDLDADNNDVSTLPLGAERKRLKAFPVELPKLERQPIRHHETGEVISVGQHYVSLDRAGWHQVLSSEYYERPTARAA